MTQDTPQPIVAVEAPAELARAARAWVAVPALAIDTEFVRERTFFHRLGLIQVSDGSAAYLVDPLTVGELGPVVEVFRAPVVKVLHSGSEDIEVFYHGLGTLPAPLFDTQVGAALAGLGPSLGYGRLVAEMLGVELFKQETRTDWLARPLSEAQRAYAAEDVAYLLPVYERLRARLAELGRLDWAFEDSAALLDTSRFEEDPERAYLRVKGAGRLDRRQLVVLRALAAWREREARRRDLPRRFVLKEDLLLALATRRPTTSRELERLPSLDRRQGARDAATWLEIVREAAALPERELPPPIQRLPFSPAVKDLSAQLRELAARRAAELALPTEVLTPRRTLDALIASALAGPEPRLPEDLTGWRREVIGEALLEATRAAAPGLPRARS